MVTTTSIIKMRLGRLLGLKTSKFRKKQFHSFSSTMTDDTTLMYSSNEQMSTATSSVTSDTSSDDESVSFPSSSKSNQLSDVTEYGYCYSSGFDPYADVRERMEELRRCDRQRIASVHESSIAQTDKNKKSKGGHAANEPVASAYVAYFAYMSFAILILIGHIKDFFAFVFRRGRYLRRNTGHPSDNTKKYAPLLKPHETFFQRRLLNIIQDLLHRPIASNPGAVLTVLERVSDDGQKTLKVLGPLSNLETIEEQEEYTKGKHFTLSHDGKVARQCLNLGSYNYLGFADDWQESCAMDVKGTLREYSVSAASCRSEYGTSAIHRELERTVAEFLGKEDAIVLNMGYNTNATTIPALVGPGDLIISDTLNHTSIANGSRASGATIRTFKHNDMAHLELRLREAIVQGRPRTHRPWNKILVIVEGIYSMEGDTSDLRNVTRLCKLYGAYVYLDEAHSIGAMGATGRGLSEYSGTDPADIDIMMGTFTKSFGGMGGYIAADKAIINDLRQRCAGFTDHNSLSPVVCQQILTCFKIITGQDGTTLGQTKLHALRDNANYFRMRIREMGLQALGQYDSPVIPVMLYLPGKISGFTRECFKRGLAVVVVGFPAVPLLMSRVRFCISAGHTREYLDRALKEIDEVATILDLRYQPINPDIELLESNCE